MSDIIRKTISVKGGVAWVTIAKYPKGKAVKFEWLQRDPDGVIRRKEHFNICKEIVTGDCPKCHQMPCVHTAKLLGWPTSCDISSRFKSKSMREGD